MNGWIGHPKGLRQSPVEDHISDLIRKIIGKMQTPEWKALLKLAGKYHSTLKQGVLSLNNLFVFHSNTCILKDFRVNIYFSLHLPNSPKLGKSYFSILSSFFIFFWTISKACKPKGHVSTCTTECFKLPEIFIGNTELSLISWQYTVKWCCDKSNRNDNITLIQQLDSTELKI